VQTTLAKPLSEGRLQEVGWTLDPVTTPREHVRRNHRRTDILVPESFLHGANVLPRFEERRRTRVAQRMSTGWLRNGGLTDSSVHRPRQDQCVEVMPPDDARPWVPRRPRGRQDL
jgi:hypothetical protein